MQTRRGVTGRRDTNVNHANNTTIGLTWETKPFESPTGWGVVPTATFTVPAGGEGTYEARVRAGYAASFSGTYGFAFIVAGVQQWHAGIPNAALPGATSGPWELAVGNTIVVNAFQSSAGDQTLDFADLIVRRVAP